MVKRRIRHNKTVVISARVHASIAARLDWLVKNHNDVEDRTEGIKDAVKSWIEAREKETLAQGLFPPSF